MNIPLDSPIEKLNLKDSLVQLLKEHQIMRIEDLWKLTKKDLAEMNFDKEDINQLQIHLQLWGLDFDCTMY